MSLKPYISALSANYYIDRIFGLHMAAIAHLIYQGKMDLQADTFEVKANSNYVEEYTSKTDTGEVTGRLSIIEMEGPMFRDDQFCGPMGMMSMGDLIKARDADPDIDAHLIKMHTPGGEVSGTESLANIVLNTQKPVVLWGEDILSAGMYIAAGASAIVLSGKNARVGSIGIQASYQSFKKYFENLGIEEVTIKATTSPDKNVYDLDNLTEEDKANYALEYLDPLDTNFMNHVRANRPGVPETALTGKVYYAEQAIKLGLADHIGSFDAAKQLALDMAGKSQTKISMSTQTGANSTAQTETHLADDLQAKLTAAHARVEVLEKMVTAKDETIVNHLLTIENLNNEVNNLKAETDRLAKLPATDTEASTTAPPADAANIIEDDKPKGEPVPEAVAQAIARGKARKQRQLAKQKSE